MTQTALAKILKRKDAASVSIAVVVGLATTQLLTTIVEKPATLMSNANHYSVAARANISSGYSLRQDLLLPVIIFILQLLALEILVRIVIIIASASNPKSKKS